MRLGTPGRAAALVVLAMGTAARVQGADLLVRNARLIDGTGAPPRGPVSILIRSGRVSEIAAEITAPAVPVLDADGATVLPGLMDMHVHFIAAPGSGFRKDSQETVRELDRQHLRAYLACGVTTVLDAGIDPPTARDIQAWLAGGHAGPRFLTTGPYVRPPGGYGWSGFGTESTPEEIEAKLDLIQSVGGVGVKIALEAGWNPLASLGGFSPELRRALIDGAARRQLPLYVHATSEKAQAAAVEWGAHAIMHAVWGGVWTGQPMPPSDLSEDFIARVKASGAYQVTTFSIVDNWPGLFQRARLEDPLVRLTVPEVELASARDPRADRYFAIATIGFAAPWIPEMLRPFVARRLWTERNLLDGLAYSQRNVRRLYEAGVPIVVGTDAPSPWDMAIYHFHGPTTVREIELLGQAGLPPLAAVLAATRTPAKMLGMDAELGTVEVGRRADLVIVRDDPLQDLGALRTIRWTVQDGVARTPEEWMSAP
jgi:imidazolonepropionase-like amidohydrolase